MRFLQPLTRAKHVRRGEYLSQAVRGLRALHVGCVDSGLLQERLDTGNLLHDALMVSASELWGMDIDRNGIEIMRAHGYGHVFEGSIEHPPAAIPREYFDVVIAGELIEHVRNVGLFLDSVLALLKPGGRLVITTPNALRFYNTWPALLGRELVHPDHLSWFSPYTLRRAVESAGFATVELRMYGERPWSNPRMAGGLAERLLRHAYNCGMAIVHAPLTALFPCVSDGLIIAAQKRQYPSP